MVTLLATLFIIGILVFVHELGHFLAAKAVGVGVLQFSLGFGAPVLRYSGKETLYTVGWIPLGGFVKFSEEQGRDFDSKSLWARILIVLAGVLMNFLLGTLLFIGLSFSSTALPPAIVGRIQVKDSTGEARALLSLSQGDTILRIGDKKIEDLGELRNAVFHQQGVTEIWASSGEKVVVRIPEDTIGKQEIYSSIIPFIAPVIGRVDKGSVGDKLGLRKGDTITHIGTTRILLWGDIQQTLEETRREKATLTLVRDGSRIHIPFVSFPTKEVHINNPLYIPRIGIFPYLPTEKRSVSEAIPHGVGFALSTSVLIASSVTKLFTDKETQKQVGGPIAIGQMSGKAAKQGWRTLLVFLAIMSINLAIFNLLPIPVLDGGHLIFLLLEGAIGKPVPEKWKDITTKLGLLLLLLFMFWAFFNDIIRLLNPAG